MEMNIRDGENEGVKEVTLDNTVIFVTVCKNTDAVGEWIRELMENIFRGEIVVDPLVVGVRVEWRRGIRTGFLRRMDHRVDILQFCVKNYCLIFQIRHADNRDNIPQQFVRIVSDARVRFMGIGIRRDLEILRREYGIQFGQNVIDLRDIYLSMKYNPSWSLRHRVMNYGLEKLYKLVCIRNYARPINMTFSKWDELELDNDQIMHACAGAYVCNRVGQTLIHRPVA